MKRNFETVEEFLDYLQNTLIPDLKDSGMENTAQDFEEAISWIEELKKS